MKLVSAGKGPLHVQVEGRPPFIQGATEMRFPPKGLTFECGIPIDLSERECGRLMEKYEREGLVLLVDGLSLEDAMLKGKRARMDWLSACIRNYRETQALRKAQGLELTMPRDLQRAQLREVKELQAELEAIDPVLNADLPPALKPEKIVDPLAKELREFGLVPAEVPMSPIQEGDMLEV